MHKLTVTLKQHTPLIHFQHDQGGATLRASEVKPKLDRFIIERAFHNNFEECKKYLVGYTEKEDRKFREKFEKGFRALNYKMRVESLISDTIKMPLTPKTEKNNQGIRTQKYNEDSEPLFEPIFPMILGNMGGKIANKVVNFSFSTTTNIFIHSYNEEIIKVIKNLVDLFFAINNFGSRNNKGFGSFFVQKLDGIYVKFDETKLYKGAQLLEFDLSEDEQEGKEKKINLNTYKIIFGVVDYYWKRLKSGINYGQNEYSKSFLYTYLNKELKRTWEKRKIKETFRLGDRHIETIPNSNPVIFGRALLGMPDKFEYGNNRIVEISHPVFERIASPIYFKPRFLNGVVSIYILVKDEHMCELSLNNDDFIFKKDGRSLPLPLKKKIDYHDLLSKFHDSFDFDETEEGRYYYFAPIKYNGEYFLTNNSRVNIYQV